LTTAHSSIPSLINTIGNLEQSRRQIEINKPGTENQNKTKKKQQNLALDDLEKLWARQEAIDEEVQFQQRKNSKKEKEINTKTKKTKTISFFFFVLRRTTEQKITKPPLHLSCPVLSFTSGEACTSWSKQKQAYISMVKRKRFKRLFVSSSSSTALQNRTIN
jgi:hypothetical protein